MRTCHLIIVLFISSGAIAQDLSDPFKGGIEFGLGYGTIVDFNLDNNNLYPDYLLERFLWLPFQVGIVSAKYLNTNKYLEIGVMFARRSSSYVYRYDHRTDGGYASALPTLNLYSIDIPVKYYSYAGKVLNKEMFAFAGIIPSWLIKPETGSSYNDIPEDCFRKVYLSVCGGLCTDRRKSRLKLHTALAVTSVVNESYREIPEDERGYGGRIYPAELIFSYARMFR